MNISMTSLSRPNTRGAVLLAGAAALLAALTILGDTRTPAQGQGDPQGREAQVQIGFEISPVELDLRGKNPALVGLGSYLVNAHSGCSLCHTAPHFLPGGDPFLDQPTQINAGRFLAGGRAFGPFVSRNLTPDPETGLPAGMTFEEFLVVMRTGVDLDRRPPHVPNADLDLLQVMPWPELSGISDRDLRAIYEYLSAIPSVP